MRNRYLISGSITTMLISNFVRYIRVTKKLHPWHHHGSHVTWIQFKDRIENEGQILYFKFYMPYWLQLCQICWGDIRFEFMTSSCWSGGLSTVVSQVLYGLLTTNFVRYVRMTKELHPWNHHGGHVTKIQLTN